MTASMEAFGSDSPFDLRTFIKAFVAGLVIRDMKEVRPEDVETRRGFARVVLALDRSREDLKATGADRGLIRHIGRLANELRPSNTGAFDGFESALRQVQLTFTSSPNPEYDDIVFSVSKAYAAAALENLPVSQQLIVSKAVSEFVGESTGAY